MSVRAELADRLERELGTDELPGMWRLPAADVRIIIKALRSEYVDELRTLATALYSGDDSKPMLELARKVMERHGWPHNATTDIEGVSK